LRVHVHTHRWSIESSEQNILFLTLFVPNCGFYSIVRYNVYKSLLDEKKKLVKNVFTILLHNWQKKLQNQDFNSVNHLLPDEILGIAKFTNIKK
jgi:hypothetical protein